MTNGNRVAAAVIPATDEEQRIAYQLGQLVKETRNDNRRDRWLVYAILAVAGIAIALNGANLWNLITSMSRDMDEMNRSMQTMKEDMASMRRGITEMSSVMATMSTMGPDMHAMTAQVGNLSRDVAAMSVAVGNLTQSVGVMSTMTPAVQRMSHDTANMGRDMHWMMPYNWVPFQ